MYICYTPGNITIYKQEVLKPVSRNYTLHTYRYISYYPIYHLHVGITYIIYCSSRTYSHITYMHRYLPIYNESMYRLYICREYIHIEFVSFSRVYSRKTNTLDMNINLIYYIYI